MENRLSKNFTLAELVRSQTATRAGLSQHPNQVAHDNLCLLCATVLQPVRDKLGPTHVTSGYRSPELNKLIGGSRNSQHTKGQAADIVVAGYTPYQVAQKIESSMLPFDQLILEFGEWVHVSIAPKGEQPRGQVLTAVRQNTGRTLYVEGLQEPERDDA